MQNLKKGYIKLHQSRNNEFKISYLTQSTISDIEAGALDVEYDDTDGTVVLSYPSDYTPQRIPPTVWKCSSHRAEKHGTTLLNNLLGQRGAFNFPKSLYAVTDTLRSIVKNKPDAIILDFFAGSGTTLHATALLNSQDSGKRQCILITNNEISGENVKLLNQKGVYKGDLEYEQRGIFQSVTVPRLEAACLGVGKQGKIEGKYLERYAKDRLYSDGFPENIEFFHLEYLEPDLIQLGRQFNQLSPLLWMRTGSIGKPEYWDHISPYLIADYYAVLFDERYINEFSQKVGSSNITHVWLDMNSHSVFTEAKQVLPDHIKVHQLYEEYLRHCRTEQARMDTK